MKAAVRCNSLALGGSGANTLVAQERHGKRLDLTSQKRRVRDAKPLLYRSLDLRAEYDRHMQGVKQNVGCKRPVLHFIIKFPVELLEDGAPGPYGRQPDRDARKKLMGRQAVDFINRTHGGSAVFAARVDRDEAGETVVDVFAAPRYTKTTKRGEALWSSPTKFGKELALRHQDEIRRRHPKAAGRLTGPRHVGIALQAEFAAYFEQVNGTALAPRTLKNEPRRDRLETEAFKAVAEAQAAVDQSRGSLRAERRMVEEKLTRQFDRVEAMTLAAVQDRQLAAAARKEAENDARAAKALRKRLALLVGRMVRWLRRDDLTLDAREAGSGLILEASEMVSGASGGHPDPDLN
ncbi:hypothetical protein NM680_19955 [Paracoccus sp. PS-1]|uniref:hypothetical protein n=1 Tax=unclassified Paracoccus (in: a-proteobacteria) TaxID=2688777 RepID=UPI00258D81CF|nr:MULTISPECIES: hypothetical protein [unclassified Paracoccus (in: a-proteobacteria)]MDQ7264069.1 hypothetical protein [Paracoccus sp. PS1]